MRTGLVAPLVLVGVVAGCGSQTNYANDPRPASNADVSAAITQGRIHVSPNSIGAGPLVVTVANLEHHSYDVELVPVAGGKSARSGPINPQGTATIQLDVSQGTYRVRVAKGTITPDLLKVGKARKSAQNELLQP
jgi:hypothetical protein